MYVSALNYILPSYPFQQFNQIEYWTTSSKMQHNNYRDLYCGTDDFC